MTKVVTGVDAGRRIPSKDIAEFSTVKGGQAKTADVNKAMARFLDESQDSAKRDCK